MGWVTTTSQQWSREPRPERGEDDSRIEVLSNKGMSTKMVSNKNNITIRTNDKNKNNKDKDNQPKSGKQQRKEDYERRKALWLDRYGSLSALQATFGTRPSFWGDLTPEQTRRLYHTLLPRSLLALYELGLMNPQELAPLAYEARIAAKQYARSRCIWTARLATEAFDQYRNLRDRGRFGSSSLTWDELWSKYEAQIVQEECAQELEAMNKKKNDNNNNNHAIPMVAQRNTKKTVLVDKKKSKELSMRIYLRILEKSCATNQAFDKLFLKNTSTNDINNDNNDDDTDPDQLLYIIASTLDHDVREILLHPKEAAKAMRKTAKLEKKQQKAQEKAVKKQEKAQAKEAKKQRKALQKEERQMARLGDHDDDDDDSKKLKNSDKENIVDDVDEVDGMENNAKNVSWDRTTMMMTTTTTMMATTTTMEEQKRRRWQVLKILAGTRRQFRMLLKDKDDDDDDNSNHDMNSCLHN